MKRQEFIDEVNSFGDLIMICQENGIDICDDIYDGDCVNEFILGSVRTAQDWREIRDLVVDIPTDCAYYREDVYGSFEDADHYFDDYKEDVLRAMDQSGEWDEDDEADDEAVPDEDEEIEFDSFMDIIRMAAV